MCIFPFHYNRLFWFVSWSRIRSLFCELHYMQDPILPEEHGKRIFTITLTLFSCPLFPTYLALFYDPECSSALCSDLLWDKHHELECILFSTLHSCSWYSLHPRGLVQIFCQLWFEPLRYFTEVLWSSLWQCTTSNPIPATLEFSANEDLANIVMLTLIGILENLYLKTCLCPV